MANNWAVELNNLLDEYSRDVKDAEENARKKAARDTASRLKNTSAKRTGDYARGWTTKQNKTETIVHNSKHYQLTHLLENGHVIRNKYGEYGRTSGDGKIKEAEEFGVNEYIQEVERELNR